jgi:hypothetical protein
MLNERTARHECQSFLTCLWELSGGLRACVVEHPAAPRWELCLVRRGDVVGRHRCATIAELMAESLAEYVRASGGYAPGPTP